MEQSLIRQITDQVQALPQDLRKQVLDFVGYLHAKYLSNDDAERARVLEATFDSWQDEQEAEEIVRDIYAQRTTSDTEIKL